MPLAAAEAIVEKRAVPLNAPGVHGAAARGLKFAFYDRASRQSFGGFFAVGGVPAGRRQVLADYTPDTLPAGICVDAAVATTATGKLAVTFLQTTVGDASSQVVARVHLIDAVPPEKRVAREATAVHYYEAQAIARYGQPTYRDPFQAHRDVAAPSGAEAYATVGSFAVPLGSLGSALCNDAACTEHQGRLTWCSGGVSAQVCSKRSVIPEDSRKVGFHYPPPHASSGPVPAETFDPHVNHTQADLERLRAERQRRSGDDVQNDLATLEEAHPYALLGQPAVTQRLLLRFDPNNDNPDIVLEDEALFARRFPIETIAPHPVATPAF